MAGQIIQRGENVFLVRVFLGRDKDGKRRYHNKTIHGTKKDAQRYLTAVLRERDLGTFAEPTRMTLDEYLDKWLEAAVKPRVQTRTYDDYEAILKRYVREPLGLKKLHQITSIEIQNLYSSMMQKGLSPRTVRYLHAVLHDALDQAVTWGLIPKNRRQGSWWTYHGRSGAKCRRCRPSRRNASSRPPRRTRGILSFCWP